MSTAAVPPGDPAARHPAYERTPLGDLGLTITAVDDELHGDIPVVPGLWVPGTTSVRISVLAAWADTQLGLLAMRVLAPRVPVTLELDVHLFGEIRGTPTIAAVGRLTKAGSSVLVLTIEFLAGDERVGFGHALFMAAPDRGLTMPTGDWALDRFAQRGRPLDEPFAERVGCVRTGAGTAELAHAPHRLNSSNTMNGGLLAVAVEEAALSADPAGRPLASLQLRYVRPVRTGPAVATASASRGLAEVEVHDAGTGALAILATTRSAA